MRNKEVILSDISWWKKEIEDNPGHPANVYAEKAINRLNQELEEYINMTQKTNSIHGGKVYCHKCNKAVLEEEPCKEIYKVFFHEDCFNNYEHYYGLDKPID